MSDSWASDVPVSAPAAIDPARPGLVDLGGFTFTTGGIAHNITQADREELLTPTYAPDGVRPT